MTHSFIRRLNCRALMGGPTRRAAPRKEIICPPFARYRDRFFPVPLPRTYTRRTGDAPLGRLTSMTADWAVAALYIPHKKSHEILSLQHGIDGCREQYQVSQAWSTTIPAVSFQRVRAPRAMAPVPMSRAAAGTRRIATVAAQLNTRVAAKTISPLASAKIAMPSSRYCSQVTKT